MIYKRVRVVNQYIAAGQIVGAPVAPLPITGSNELYQSATKVVFEDVFAFGEFANGRVQVHPRFYPLVPAAQNPMRFDVSADVYIELKGHFHFPPLVLYEGIGAPVFGKQQGYTAFIQREESVAFGTSATQAPLTMGRHFAYMLLTPAKFTGEVIFRNTVGDRTEPFQFPLRAHTSASVPYPVGPSEHEGRWSAATVPMTSAGTVDKVVELVRRFVNQYPLALRAKWNWAVGLPDQEWEDEVNIPAIPLEASGLTSLVGIYRPDDCQVVSSLVEGREVTVRYLPWSKEGAWINMFAGSGDGAIKPSLSYVDIYRSLGDSCGRGFVLMFKVEGKLPLRFALVISYEYYSYITNKVGLAQGPFNFADDNELGIAVVENPVNSPTFKLPMQILHRPSLEWKDIEFVTATTLDYMRGGVGVRTLLGADMYSPSPLMLEILTKSI